MESELLTPREVDVILRYPRGRSAKLARRGLLAAVKLPDGEVRFRRDVIEELVRQRVYCGREAS
jgi:hypothetical protein